MKQRRGFIPYPSLGKSGRSLDDLARAHYELMNRRRSCRFFSSEPVARSVIENLIRTAGTAPSGAHKQPWHFAAVQDPELKSAIRAAAEKEEKAFYEERAPEDWLEDLAPLGTDWQKPFLDIAPWLIVVFKQSYAQSKGGKEKHYYVNESVGIAAGILISAIHQCGLVTLTHTPSPMNFLAELLNRPANEKPFLLLPVGYPAQDAQVPDLRRKALEEIAQFH